MVDGAIVMIENVHKHMEREALTDKNRWRIITEASIEVGPAIFFSLLIITISFLPVFALEAQEGRMFHPRLHQDLRHGRRRRARHHAGAGDHGLLHPWQGAAEQANPLNRWLSQGYVPLLNAVLARPKPPWPSPPW
jgi:Cu(I)/Ag(I) efflux system membrane protein CusA/SilA